MNTRMMELPVADGGSRRVTAYYAAPGLMVHRALNDEAVWTISHRATGLRISPAVFPTTTDAEAAAKAITHLADWAAERPAESLKANGHTSADVYRVLANRAAIAAAQAAARKAVGS